MIYRSELEQVPETRLRHCSGGVRYVNFSGTFWLAGAADCQADVSSRPNNCDYKKNNSDHHFTTVSATTKTTRRGIHRKRIETKRRTLIFLRVWQKCD